MSINCPERPGTPDTQCSICLGDLTNKCNSDSCSHTFCFECLKRWSDVKPTCPLCKNIFKSIHHSFTSDGLHDTYIVPSQEVIDHEDNMNLEIDLLIGAFQRIYGMPSTDVLEIQNFNDNNIASRLVYNNIVGNHHNYGEPFHDQVIGEITRTRVYNENLWAQPLPDINGRFRDFSSTFFRNELNAICNDIEIVNPPFEPPVVVNPPVETIDFTSDQPSTSTGIRTSLNQPNNRYNLRKRRLFPSTSSSSSCPANLSNKRSPTHLRRGNNMNSSSSDEEYMTSSDESITSSGEEFIPSARGSQCPHLDKPAAF